MSIWSLGFKFFGVQLGCGLEMFFVKGWHGNEANSLSYVGVVYFGY